MNNTDHGSKLIRNEKTGMFNPNNWELSMCDKCVQMTNHYEGACLKCSPKNSKKQCVAGCTHYTGGEVKHHKDCPFYDCSLSQAIDNLLTAAKVSTVDEVVELLERKPLSDEEIEQAFNNNFDCYADLEVGTEGIEGIEEMGLSIQAMTLSTFTRVVNKLIANRRNNGWVDVNDRLPEVDDKFEMSDYLLCVDDALSTAPFVAWYSKGSNTWTVAHHLASSEPVKVTRYSPLPPKPQQ